MRRAPLALLVTIGCVLTLLLTAYYLRTAPLKHLDTVFLYESALSVLDSGQPTSSTLPSFAREALGLFTLPAGEFCQADLSTEDPTAYNIVESHAYMAIYPISILTLMLGPETAFAVLNALAHALLLVIPMLWLWRSAGILAALVMGLWVALYPVWSYSATGDYYLDRLAMPFMLLALFLMEGMARHERMRGDARWLTIWALLTVAAAAFTERAALMMIGAIGFFLVFYPTLRKSSRTAGVMVITALGLVLYLGWYFTSIRIPVPGAGDLFESVRLALQSDPLALLQRPGMTTFLAVNLLLAGPLIVVAGARYVLLVIGAMLPNILIVIGGAELTGFTTHYHTMYLPFVVFAVAIGIGRSATAPRSRALRAGALIGVSVYMLVLTATLNPHTGRFLDEAGNPLGPGIGARIWSQYTNPDDSYLYLSDIATSIASLVPPGVHVSTVESAMPALYRGRSLSLYPLDFDEADYLVVPGTASQGQITALGGAVSYLGADVAEAINECLRERAIARGYSVVGDLGGTLILRRSPGGDGSRQ